MGKRNRNSAIIRATFVEALERRTMLTSVVSATAGQPFDVGDLDSSAADVYVPAGASVSAEQIRANSLTVAGNLTLDENPDIFDTSHVTILNSLNLPTDGSDNFIGTLNINDDAIIVRPPDAATAQTDLTLIEAAVKSGFDDGDWLGKGITSTDAQIDAQNNGYMGIGYFYNNNGDGTQAYASFANVPLQMNDIIISYTAYGDANLQGNVTTDDFNAWLNGYENPTTVPPTWQNGDFLYHGTVNPDDFNMWLYDFQANLHLAISVAPQSPLTDAQYLASFTSSDSPISAEDFTAATTWGGGTSSSADAIVSDGNGTYHVFGDHTYSSSDLGGYTTSTTVTDSTSNAITGQTNATAEVSSIQPTGQNVNATEGESFTGVVAVFNDNNANPADLNYAATVQWPGSGSPVPATVTQVGADVFDVNATYAFGATGSFMGLVSINASDGTFATAATDVYVSNVNPAQGQSINATDNVNYSGPLATFTDASGANASGYTSSINFGDNTSTYTGTITQSGSTFTVSGSHTFTMPGDYTATITITPPDGGVPNTVLVDANVSSIVPGATQSFSPVQGDLQTFTVATFTDTVSSTPLANYTPVVDWGDGNITGGTITSSTSGSVTTFTVTASNAYASAGTFSPTVTITSTDGSTSTITDSATVSGIIGSGTGITPTQKASYAGPVANFFDSRTGLSGVTYTASINWGDNSTPDTDIPAVPDGMGDGGYIINGTHTYSAAGDFSPTITITSSDGLTATLSASAEVSGIVINPGTVNAISGTSFSGPVFDFTDDGPTTGTDTYTPTIAWGDGTTSAGVYVSDGNNDNGYVVSGTHTYSEPGNYNATVTVTGANSGFTATDTVTINVAGITATAASTITGEEGQTFAGPVATFTSSVSGTSASGYSAGINWGDGNNSPGIITKNGSTFTVSGTNVFAQAGTIAPTVTITDPSGELTTVTDSATVDGIVVTTQAVPGTAGVNSNYVLGTFSDTASGTSGLTYTAFADWQGNGNPIALTVTSQGEGVYQVSGDYNFPVGQTTDPIISVYASNGVFSTANGEVDVQASYGTTPQLLNPVAGSTFAGIVGDFTYSVPNTDPSQFQGTITWGDGNTSDGIITSDGQGGFDVIGTNTFASAGNYLPSISVSDQYGNSTTITDTALVGASSPITTQPGSATATEGTPYTFYFAPVQPSGGTISSWSLNWGDGSALVEGSGGPPPASLQHTFASGYSSSNITYGFSGSMGNSNGSWTAGVVPASPTNVNASWNSNGTASLTWDESSSLANGFTISQSVNGTAFVPVATITSATTTSDTLSGLDPTADYAFQVNANGSGGTTSPTSGPGSGSDSGSLTAFDGDIPTGPETPNLTATNVTSTEIDLSFTIPTDGSTLVLEWLEPGDQNFHTDNSFEVTGTSGQTATAEIGGLIPNSEYQFVMRAALLGQVAYSGVVDVVTQDSNTEFANQVSITPDQTVPGQVDVSWPGDGSDPTSTASLYARFQLPGTGDDDGTSPQQTLTSDLPEPLAVVGTYDSASGMYSGVAQLLPGYSYNAQLSFTYDSVNTSSEWTNVATLGTSTILAAPTNLSIGYDFNTDQPDLTWDYDPAELGDVYFNIVTCSSGESSSGSFVNTLFLNCDNVVAGQTYLDLGTVSSSETYYVIASNNPINEGLNGVQVSAPSNAVVATPSTETPPAAPSNLTATMLGYEVSVQDKVSLIWNDNSNNESGFIVQSRLVFDGANPAWQTIDQTGPDQTNFVYALPGGDPVEWQEPRQYRVIAFVGSSTGPTATSSPTIAPAGAGIDPAMDAEINLMNSDVPDVRSNATFTARQMIDTEEGYDDFVWTAAWDLEDGLLWPEQTSRIGSILSTSDEAILEFDGPALGLIGSEEKDINAMQFVPVSVPVVMAWPTHVPNQNDRASSNITSESPEIVLPWRDFHTVIPAWLVRPVDDDDGAFNVMLSPIKPGNGVVDVQFSGQLFDVPGIQHNFEVHLTIQINVFPWLFGLPLP